MKPYKNKQMTETLTPREVARKCGFGVTNTYKMLADGTIPSIRVGNRFFIPRVALENWLASCGKPDGGGKVTAAELANSLLLARPVGDGRWMARCPAHNDRSPSLYIRTGRDRRVLVRCWAGCRTEHVLERLGLNWKDICGEPMTDAQAREAMAERRKRGEQELLQRSADRAACDRIRRLEAVADELVSRLVRTPDHDPACHAMARLLQETLNQLRRIDMEVAR